MNSSFTYGNVCFTKAAEDPLLSASGPINRFLITGPVPLIKPRETPREKYALHESGNDARTRHTVCTHQPQYHLTDLHHHHTRCVPPAFMPTYTTILHVHPPAIIRTYTIIILCLHPSAAILIYIHYHTAGLLNYHADLYHHHTACVPIYRADLYISILCVHPSSYCVCAHHLPC